MVSSLSTECCFGLAPVSFNVAWFPNSFLTPWHTISQAYLVHIPPGPATVSPIPVVLSGARLNTVMAKHIPPGREAVSSSCHCWCSRGGRRYEATSLHSRFWPLAGPAGKDHGEKPRKTKPSCLCIFSTRQLAKS